MSRDTLPVERFARFTGVAPAVPNRPCGGCGHREADSHLLDWRGKRAACGRAHRGLSGQRRCSCNRFTPPGDAR